MKIERVYLDYAASTPVDPAVLKAMTPYWNEEFGNPGSLHSFGQRALGVVDKAREAVAKAINADFREVIFTGSATEVNNLALRGVLRAFSCELLAFSGLEKRRRNLTANSSKLKAKVIISAIEHESVLDTARDLEKDGIEVVYIPVDKNGIVEIEKIKEALDGRTVLVSVMSVNNEIGSVQPIAEISEIIRNFRATSEKRQATSSIMSRVSCRYPLFHTDAAQALNYFDCDVQKLGVDLMTLSGQKIYGPKGIGALYARQATSDKRQEKNVSMSHIANFLSPIVTGGGQEFGLRSGTENVPLIVGFGKAVELAQKERKKNYKNIESLKNYFWRGLKKFYPQAEINGESAAPHILNIYFPTEFAGDLLVKLDLAGVAISSGSACSARSFSPSYVLQALGLSQERVRGSLRFSFGKTTSREELDYVLKILRKILALER